MDISVIVPFYKGNCYMQQLFAIVAANAKQAKPAQVELLIVNDSPEQPVEYDPAWVEGFSLRILENETNMGIHGSRVNGIRHAHGTYIQMLDQDDLLAENALASQLAAIGDAQVCVANGIDQAGKGAIYESPAHQQWATRPRFYYSLGNMIVSPGQCLLRRDAVPAFWMEQIMTRNGSDDLLLWLLLFGENATWAVNPQSLYTHVFTGQNVSSDGLKMSASSREVLEKLEQNGKLTPKERRRFRRSRSLGRRLVGKGKAGKALAMLCYPDVLIEKLILKRIKG